MRAQFIGEEVDENEKNGLMVFDGQL